MEHGCRRLRKGHNTGMRVTSKKLAAWVTTALAVISFSRVAVLFLESLSVGREERNADAELLEVWRSGAAKASPKMRTACLQAQAERASPIVLKAIVRAVSTTFKEFYESVNSPFGFATALLFVLSSLVLPIIPMVKAFAGGGIGFKTKHLHVEYDSDDDDHQHVVMVGPHGLKRRASRALRFEGGV